VEALDEVAVEALDETEVGVPDIVDIKALGEGEVGVELLLCWYSSASGDEQ